MNSTRSKQMTAVFALLLGMGVAPLSYAQYVWLNDQGVKQFSDMPPPASVPKNRILKAPGGVQRAPSSSTEEASAPVADAAKKEKDRSSMTAAELEADYKKRKMLEAEKEKKAADAAKAAEDKARNCERVRAYARTLDSGERITKMDKNGEKVFLSDEQRAQEASEAKRRLGDC